MIELWNWRIDGRVPPVEIHAALVDAFGLPVLPLDRADPDRYPADALLCDVWHIAGEFPTLVDCYGVPADLAEPIAVAAFVRQLGRHCLLPDDTLDAGRYLLVAPGGTIRPVHLEVQEGAEGETLTNRRLCTRVNPRCRGWSTCGQSRWAPDSVLPALAAA